MAFGMSVKAFLAEHSSAEISELLAYDRIDPVGNVRGDMQAAVVASAVSKGKIEDHLLKFWKAKEIKTISTAEDLRGFTKPGK